MLIKAEQLLSPISREEVRIMGDDHQVFSDNDDNADGLDVVDQLIKDSTIVTTPGAPLDPAYSTSAALCRRPSCSENQGGNDQ